MTSRDFAFWLQGFFEISNPQTINEEQTLMIKSHLSLVFKHEIDPSMGDKKHQEELNKIHSEPKLGDTFPFNSNNLPNFNTTSNLTEKMRC